MAEWMMVKMIIRKENASGGTEAAEIHGSAIPLCGAIDCSYSRALSSVGVTNNNGELT